MGAHDQVVELRERMGRSIIGQEHIIERLILGLLCNGNLLVEQAFQEIPLLHLL